MDTPIKQMNYVIGVFDGKGFSMSHINDYTAENAPPMKYHNNWQWIMRVVKKIYKLLADMQKQRPPHTACQGDLIEVDIHCAIREVDILKTHGFVYQFIQWYNLQKASEVLMNPPENNMPQGMPLPAADPFASVEYRGPDSHCKACEDEKIGVKHIKAPIHTCRKRTQ